MVLYEFIPTEDPRLLTNVFSAPRMREMDWKCVPGSDCSHFCQGHCLIASCVAIPQEFEQDASNFKQQVEDMDRRLGTIFCQAFDDASDLEHAFKVCVVMRESTFLQEKLKINFSSGFAL